MATRKHRTSRSPDASAAPPNPPRGAPSCQTVEKTWCPLHLAKTNLPWLCLAGAALALSGTLLYRNLSELQPGLAAACLVRGALYLWACQRLLRTPRQLGALSLAFNVAYLDVLFGLFCLINALPIPGHAAAIAVALAVLIGTREELAAYAPEPRETPA